MLSAKQFAVFVVLLVGAGRVGAALLAGWDVAGVDLDDGIGIVSNASPYMLFSTTTDVEHVTAYLGLGAGVNPTTTAGQYGFKISSSDQTNSLSGAIAQGHYIEILIAVDDGYLLALESMELFGEGSANACSNIAVLGSLDEFDSERVIASVFPANVTGGFDTDSSGFGGAIDLSVDIYQGIAGTNSFRLYGWNSSSGSSPSYIRDLKGLDLKINGTIAAHPSGLAHLALVRTNELSRLELSIGSESGQSFLLQTATNLLGSNVWENVVGGISSNTTWSLSATNSSRFYRVVPE